jgi:hypothetical protein
MILGVGGRHLLETAVVNFHEQAVRYRRMTRQLMEDQLNSLGQTSHCDEDTPSTGVEAVNGNWVLCYYITLMQHVPASIQGAIIGRALPLQRN